MDNMHEIPQPPKQSASNFAEDEIDLRELFLILWAERWIILGITTLAAIASVITALMMTEVYRAEITLAPAESSQSSGGMAQFSGAAALLGVNVGGNSGDNVSTALATLQSRQFIGRFIDQHRLLVPLFASSWDKRTQQTVIDTKLYDPTTGEWLTNNGPPSEQDAFRTFSGIMTVNGPERDSGIISVAIEWPNPEQAAHWANQLIADLNQELRARDVREASSAIDYLRRQLVATQLVDMQRVFYQLIESQTRVTMLADVREEYVFRVIDPAVVPDRRSAPRRSLIAFMGTLVGGMLALMLVFVRRQVFNSFPQPSDSAT
jgi:uncharacterized protein involved in exopolysaccharide biosynthesis